MDVHRCRSFAATCAEKRTSLPCSRPVHANVRIRSQDSNTRPGNPAPVPRSSQILASGASRAIGPNRRNAAPRTRGWSSRDQIIAPAIRQEIGIDKPVDCFTWNFKGFGELFRAAINSDRFTHPAQAIFHRGPSSDGRGAEERRRRHAVEPGRLAETAGPLTFQLLAEFGGEAGDAAEGKSAE